MLPSGVRWRLLAVVGATIGRIAHADDDPRAAFGLPNHPVEPPVDCGDGTTFGCAIATDPLDAATPYGLATWIPATYLLGLPVGDATHDAVAHYALGGARDEQGVGFTGANGLETRWSIDGAPSDNARSGGSDTSVPLTFLRGIRASAGGFAARDRASTGGTVDAELLEGSDHHTLDVRLWGSWGAEPRHREFGVGIYQLRRLYTDPLPDSTVSLVATGPLPEHAWYAAGIAPSLALTRSRWQARRLVDADADNLADRDGAGFQLDSVENTERPVTSWFVPAMARVGIDRGPHHLALSLVGEVTHGERTLANATEQAAGVDRTGYTGDAIATYRGTWTDTRVRAQLAWHRNAYVEAARDPAAANQPQLLTAYVPGTLVEDPVLAAACTASGMFAPCPIPFGYFASGGAGLLVDQTADRPTATADVTHRIGEHVLRAGATLEDARVVTRSRYTGGELDRSLFVGHLDQARFHGNGTCVDVAFEGECDYLGVAERQTRTRYTAAYAEDTFHPTPAVRVNYGLRYELMWVGTRLHFSDELAPRLGIAWDFLGGGRSRAWASMGRSFAYLPTGVGGYVLPGDRIVHDITIANIGNTRSLESAAPLPIAPDLRPSTQDEATAGVEVGVAQAARMTVWAQARRLRAMETTGSALANPTDGTETADRVSTTVAAELATTGKLALRIGYFYNRTTGSTVGMADPRQGAVFYGGADFDNQLANLYGRLPSDLAHRVFFEARRTGHLAGIPVAAATRMTLASGRPRDVLAQNTEGISELLPRGSYGRNAMIAQTNLELAAHWQGFDITLDVFNLFDRTDATAVDNIYTTGLVAPIDHGTPADLVYLRTEGGAPAQRWTQFQYGTSFQSPIAATFGIRRAF